MLSFIVFRVPEHYFCYLLSHSKFFLKALVLMLEISYTEAGESHLDCKDLLPACLAGYRRASFLPPPSSLPLPAPRLGVFSREGKGRGGEWSKKKGKGHRDSNG